MNDQIKQDITNQIMPHMHEARERFPAFEDFGIVQGQEILNNPYAPDEIKANGAVRPQSYYIVMKFTGQGTRQTAEQCFKFMMEDCLGFQRTTNSVIDEIIPRREYAPSRPYNPNVRQLGAPTAASTEYIEVNDDGTVTFGNQTLTAVTTEVKPRFYAVELRIEGGPAQLPPYQQNRRLQQHQRNMRLDARRNGFLPGMREDEKMSSDDYISEKELSLYESIGRKIRIEGLGA